MPTPAPARTERPGLSETRVCEEPLPTKSEAVSVLCTPGLEPNPLIKSQLLYQLS